MARLFAGSGKLKRGVMTHITMHARLGERYGDRTGDVKRELRDAGFSRDLVKANVRKMTKLVEGLAWEPPKGGWTEYGQINTYTDADAEAKGAFVRAAVAARRPSLVWDLGCNDGRYARIAAAEGARVVALDSDQGPVELLYRDLRAAGDERVLALTMNVTDPSPGLGWRGEERRPLLSRGRPELVLCLALVHHVTITANVPMRRLDRVAGRARRLARDRVPHPRGSDGAAAAGRQEGGHPPRLRAHGVRALPRRRVRGRALRNAGLGHARALPRPPARAPGGPVSPALRDGLGRRALELAVLCAFAFAQPLFDLLGRNPEFFAVRGSPSGDIVLFAVGARAAAAARAHRRRSARRRWRGRASGTPCTRSSSRCSAR